MHERTSDEIDGEKRRLRREMRSTRRAVADVAGRSATICTRLIDVVGARASDSIVMTYDAMPGEPDLASFVAWCRATGRAVVTAEPRPNASPPADPADVDVVVVPGLAFSDSGERLGQGGGWYDRFLEECRAECLVIGVCFAEQLTDVVPQRPHDRRVDVVVTDRSA